MPKQLLRLTACPAVACCVAGRCCHGSAVGWRGAGNRRRAPQRRPQSAGCRLRDPGTCGGRLRLDLRPGARCLAAVRPQRPPLGQRCSPGGIGAVAFDRVASGQLGGSHALVAFSSGSLLNLAQGRFGPHAPTAVHWLVTLGTDYAVAVHRDAPWKTLQELLAALRHDVSRVVFGAGGTVGSQDWVKTALLVRAAVRTTRPCVSWPLKVGARPWRPCKASMCKSAAGCGRGAPASGAVPHPFVGGVCPPAVAGRLGGGTNGP